MQLFRQMTKQSATPFCDGGIGTRLTRVLASVCLFVFRSRKLFCFRGGGREKLEGVFTVDVER